MSFLRINMTDKTVTVEGVPKEYADLGGRGLTSIMINNDVPPACDPLGPENRLIFAPGLLSGTSLINTSRLSIGAKSPLTGGIKESNVGGTVSADLARMGISAVIVDGKAPEGEYYILKINAQGEPELVDAQEFRGMRTYALVKKLMSIHGEKNSVTCIGPAGDLRMPIASIQTTDPDNRPCRAAGRGGMGAVMGSKGLKALVVNRQGDRVDTIADPEAFKEASKFYAGIMKDSPHTKGYTYLGTASMVSPINEAGAFPSYNATQGRFDKWEKVSGETLAKTIRERGGNPSHSGCAQCIINCSNEFVDKQGKFVTSGLEYETIWSMGGMTGVGDLDTIAKLDFLCDDIGLDTMSAGVAISVAMDAGHKEFGDGQAAIDMVEEIAKGTDFGKILGGGPVAVGEHFGHHRVPVVKGQSISAYDPRALHGMAVTYATSTMGADHTAGWVVGSNLAKFGGKLDPFSAKGQVEVSRNAQIQSAGYDTTGICTFANGGTRSPDGLKAFFKMIGAKIGRAFGQAEWDELCLRVIKAEREFNRKAGFTNKDDRLPRMFYEEPLPPHNKVVVISDEEMDTTFDF
ncbi:MAG: aldehyde ferredoxin oxidoreductase [Deltaproteobacteria bacterium]|nr:aldehyde ferredoxin oxidoreductase [Deltaproteobacteria bacterium]